MVEISMTPPAGSLRKLAAWLGQSWQNREARALIGAMSEREFQDIGWGQPDRTHISSIESPEDRRARAIALKAWRAPSRKAA